MINELQQATIDSIDILDLIRWNKEQWAYFKASKFRKNAGACLGVREVYPEASAINIWNGRLNAAIWDSCEDKTILKSWHVPGKIEFVKDGIAIRLVLKNCCYTDCIKLKVERM